MNIVLIHTFYRDIYSHIKGIEYIDPPLGLTYVASSLEERGHAVSLIDAEAEDFDSHEDLAREAARREPDVVGFGFTTPMVASVGRSVREIRKILPDIPVVAGGPHATAVPEKVITGDIATYCVIGEGEEVMAELADRLSSGAGAEGCPSLCYRSGDAVVKTVRTPPIPDLDGLPLPARHLLRIERYKHASSVSRKKAPYYTNIISSRGCPFKCIFCGSVAVFGKTVRYRSAKNVGDEMEECLKRYRIGIFGFADDTLTLKKSHVLGICDEIGKRKMDVMWMAQGRVDTVDEEMLAAMKRSGCEAIHYGYESGNQDILDRLRKGTTVEQAIRATKLTKRAGIKIHGYFMIGNPGETARTIRDTIDLAKKLDPETVQFTLAQPFPGTEFSEIADRGGRTKGGFENFKWYENVNFVPRRMTEQELVSLHRRAFKEFYLRPSYLLRTLLQLRRPSKWRWILNGIRSLLNITRP